MSDAAVKMICDTLVILAGLGLAGFVAYVIFKD